MKDIGYRLRDLRSRAKLTQSEVAETAGITNVALCEIEKGRINPTVKTATAIAKACGFRMRIEISFEKAEK